MITVNNISLQFGKRILFDQVNIKFTKGNCYGIIGANGAGKSTFLKILSGEQESSTGEVVIDVNKRISTLKQDHYLYDKYSVIQTVIIGNKKLFDINNKINILYNKKNFSEKDGIEVAELSSSYDEIGGWNAESDAASILSNLGIKEKYHNKLMIDIDNKNKVRILLAQAIFGNPDILLLDEPTNGLDSYNISWLEDFILNYNNTVILVSHDRHFIDSTCTYICDIDFGKINILPGNYTFWYESSKLANKQKLQQHKKIEDKKKELQEFIQRFSSNASKAKQATSRKKILEKLNINNIKPSIRRYPSIFFEKERNVGNHILEVNNLSKKIDNNYIFKNITFSIKKGDKILLISKNERAIHTFYEIINNNLIPDTGNYSWGTTITISYFPLDNSYYFINDINLIEWLQQYVEKSEDRYEENIRNFLGRMLFQGEDTLKKVNLLSGGEKVRCMLSKMMIKKANFLIFNEPTNHLDLESITSLNNAIKKFEGNIIISSKDYELIQTVCNRILEITPKGIIDKYMSYKEYLCNDKISSLREKYYL